MKSEHKQISTRVAPVALALLLSLASPLRADEGYSSYSPIFFGLSTEFSAIPGLDEAFLSELAMESVCLTVAVGKRDLLPYPKLRARGGLGFWPGRYFLAKLGVELPVIEFLNSMQARLTGLYLYGDGIMRIGAEGRSFSAEASARILIPFNAAGGLAIGCGYDSTYGFLLHADYLAGFYAMK